MPQSSGTFAAPSDRVEAQPGWASQIFREYWKALKAKLLVTQAWALKNIDPLHARAHKNTAPRMADFKKKLHALRLAVRGIALKFFDACGVLKAWLTSAMLHCLVVFIVGGALLFLHGTLLGNMLGEFARDLMVGFAQLLFPQRLQFLATGKGLLGIAAAIQGFILTEAFVRGQLWSADPNTRYLHSILGMLSQAAPFLAFGLSIWSYGTGALFFATQMTFATAFLFSAPYKHLIEPFLMSRSQPAPRNSVLRMPPTAPAVSSKKASAVKARQGEVSPSAPQGPESRAEKEQNPAQTTTQRAQNLSPPQACEKQAEGQRAFAPGKPHIATPVPFTPAFQQQRRASQPNTTSSKRRYRKTRHRKK